MATSSDEWFTDQSYWDTNRSFIWSDRLIEMSGFAASNIEKLLGMRKGESVLDLACGFGRHSFEFHKLGFSVTGVDLNSRFIEEAKSKARETGESIRFILADMREFIEPESYNHIVILYNSFGYFKERKDDERVISNCFNSLLPGGRILISVMGQEINKRHMPSGEDRHWWENEGNYRLQECKVDEDTGWMTINWILLKGNAIQTYEYGCRLYSKPEFEQLLASAGFQDIRIYGSMNGTPYDEKAHFLVATARKSR